MNFSVFSKTARSILRPSSSPSFFARFAIQQQQVRCASILGDLRDVPGQYNKPIRRGRGPSSGKGKTSGRGHKGQKQHGKVPAGFNGGQTKLEVVHGVRGFKNVFSVNMSPLNLGKLQDWIDQGRIDPTQPITFKHLVDTRCLHGIKDGVKLLAKGKEEFKTPIEIVVSRASKEAIKAVEDAGGKVTTRYFNKNGIRSITHPHLYDGPQKLAGAFSRWDIEYYRDPEHRGYLSGQVAEGETPSLFFKTVREKTEKVVGGKSKSKAEKDAKMANRLF